MRNRLWAAAVCAMLVTIFLCAGPVGGAEAPPDATDQPAEAAPPSVSGDTEACLGCHESLHPGLVASWRKSRHAQITTRQAMTVLGPARKITAKQVPDKLAGVLLGCAECHTMRGKAHADTFDHNGYEIHLAVSPEDCATCHVEERLQYGDNIMAHAHGNLVDNPVFQDLTRSIDGAPALEGGRIVNKQPVPETEAESCLYCHGTKLQVVGVSTRDTAFGEMDFPIIEGWPNRGSGRINLDGSKGSCTPCHTRHQFSVAEARKPYTCKGCHVGPDVPAYKVYSASKHGSLYESHAGNWNFTAVPWKIGEDFTAPTCATCHISLLTDADGEVVAERTHALSPRLPWRIFGLIYAHPQPVSPDTTTIRNADNLPLPTDFKGNEAVAYLIGAGEMQKRRDAMHKICLSCHGKAWVDGHWKRFEHTIEQTNAATSVATQLIARAWKEGLAKGPAQESSPFDEYAEKLWSDVWLIHANHIRFASAMAGGGDYGVFANGRYELNGKLRQLGDWVETRSGSAKD